MKSIGLATLGRDAEVRHTSGGKTVTQLSLAVSIGWGDNKRTQWIDASWWGDRGAKLTEYLTKGQRVCVTLENLEVQEYEKKDGTKGTKLVASVVDVELAGKREESAQTAAPAPKPKPAPKTAPKTADNGFDDDIPFN